jgi:hypothetical protein
VFRRITAAGTIEGRLTGDGVYKILRVRAAAAKLTVAATEQLLPHGYRAGTITEATLNAGRADHAALATQGCKCDARLSPTCPDRGRQPGPAASTCEAGGRDRKAGLLPRPAKG